MSNNETPLYPKAVSKKDVKAILTRADQAIGELESKLTGQEIVNTAYNLIEHIDTRSTFFLIPNWAFMILKRDLRSIILREDISGKPCKLFGIPVRITQDDEESVPPVQLCVEIAR